MLKDDAQFWEGSMQFEEMRQEGGFCVEDMNVLSNSSVSRCGRVELTLAALGSDGTSPWRLRTMSTSSIASNIG